MIFRDSNTSARKRLCGSEAVQEYCRAKPRGAFFIVTDVQTILIVVDIILDMLAFISVKLGIVFDIYQFIIMEALTAVTWPVGAVIGFCIWHLAAGIISYTEGTVEVKCSDRCFCVTLFCFAETVLSYESRSGHDHFPAAVTLFFVERYPGIGSILAECRNHKQLICVLGSIKLAYPFWGIHADTAVIRRWRPRWNGCPGGACIFRFAALCIVPAGGQHCQHKRKCSEHKNSFPHIIFPFFILRPIYDL